VGGAHRLTGRKAAGEGPVIRWQQFGDPDAHVVAICADVDGVALVLTSDPDDIATLAGGLPGTRIITRSPVGPMG